MSRAGVPTRFSKQRGGRGGVPRGAQNPLLRPFELARAGERLALELRARDLPRFAEICPQSDDLVRVALAFTAAGGEHFVAMQIETTAALRCERCLAPVVLPIKTAARLLLVASEAAEDRARDCFVCKREALRAAELIEDELLLALPQTPKHPELRDCDPNVVAWLRAADDGAFADAPADTPADALADAPVDTPAVATPGKRGGGA